MRIADRLPLIGLLGALAIGAVVATRSYLSTTALAEQGAWAAHRHETIAALEHLKVDVYEVDQAARTDALAPGEVRGAVEVQGSARVDADLEHLHVLFADDDEQRRALDDLAPALQRELTAFHDEAARLRDEKQDLALAIALNARGATMQRAFKNKVAPMLALERARLHEHAHATREDVAALRRAIIAGSATSFVLLIGAFALLAREAERRQKAERRLAVTVDSIGDGVVSTDANGRVVDMNAAAERLTGWSKAGASGVLHASVVRLRDELDGAEVPSPISKVLAGGEVRTRTSPTVLVDRTGSTRPVGETTAPIRTQDGDVVGAVMVVRDVTEQRERETRFQRVLAAAPDAIIVARPDGRILHANDEATRLFGYTHDELLAATVEDLVPERLRSGHDAHRATFDRSPSVRPMGRRPFDLRARHKDGSELPVAINLAPFDTTDGPLVIAAVRDVRKEREAEENLRRARDAAEALNQELESFSYSIAHDLRAPLRSIDGFSLAVLEDAGDRLDGEARLDLQRVREAVHEMSERIDALLVLSRLSRTALHRAKVDLTGLANAIVARLRQADPGRIVDVQVQSELAALGDERLLGIVLENLIGNAWKFTARTQNASIRIGRDPETGAYSVRDNGAGFDMTQAGRLFVAFQRLHRDAEFAGTGIGLATVQRVVHMHGGKVWAEAEANKGARFFFTVGAGEPW